MEPQNPYDPNNPLNPYNPSNQQASQSAEQPTVDPNGPQQMYYTRPLEPKPVDMSPAIQARCEESKRKYPHLNLSQGEFVISDVHRHTIGLLQIWITVFTIVAAIIAMLGILFGSFSADAGATTLPKVPLAVVALLLSILTLIGGYIATYVYNSNKFYLTNESVVQNLQFGLFTNHEQTVSLGNVEDASYMKHGLIQTLFDYGTIRLSTQGDETTYRFTYAAHPSQQIAKLNDAVEAFKNGRPVYDDDDPIYPRPA
ncbi:hypothetical protein KDA23_03575 [Candidatus Saccharibacteria bacterium]|nr:hypothetical protein [Candidatus Saccharibacteria bacterium]